VNELTPTQRGILIRETGEPLGDAPPPPSIHGREFSGAEEAGIDLKELWFFDLTGCKHSDGSLFRLSSGFFCTAGRQLNSTQLEFDASLLDVLLHTDLVLPKVMDDAWVAAAQEAYDHVTADEEEVLVAVAGVGGPTNVFVTRGEGKTHGRIPSVASAAPRKAVKRAVSLARLVLAERGQRSAALDSHR